MGFGYEALAGINPRIIFAVGTGFGTEGPYAHKGGQDVLAQAMSGVMARKCDPSEPTTIYPTALADYSAGMHLVQGVLLALLQRERTGRGQMISVSLYDSMLAMQMQEAAMWLMRGRDFSWGAMPYTGVFTTTDGALVIVGAFKANPLREISLALGLEDLSADPRFVDLEASRRNRKALHQILRARIGSADTAHWIARLEERDLLCAPVRSLGEALADPQTAVNGMIVRRDGEVPLGLVGSPVHLSDAEFALRHAPPALGEDGGGDTRRARLQRRGDYCVQERRRRRMSIRLEIADRVARVTIDRPEVLNALDAVAEEALEAVWRQLDADRDVRAVVLTGAGERAFCVGADLKAGGSFRPRILGDGPCCGFGGLRCAPLGGFRAVPGLLRR